MLRHLLEVMRLHTVRAAVGLDPWPSLTDRDDEPVWRTAVVAGARYVVSNNTRHFPPLAAGRPAHGGVEYVTAIEFVEDVLGFSAEAVAGHPLPAGAPIRSARRP